MIIVLFGKPGAGKGTQAPLLAKELDVPTLATGDVLRAAKSAGTKLGLEAKGFMDRGELVPDSVILGILGEELSQAAVREGRYPRRRGAHRAAGRGLAADARVARQGRSTSSSRSTSTTTRSSAASAIARSVRTARRRTPDAKSATSATSAAARSSAGKTTIPTRSATRLRVYDQETAPVLDVVSAERRLASSS